MKFRLRSLFVLIAVVAVALASFQFYRARELRLRKEATVERLYDKSEIYDTLVSAVDESTRSSLKVPKIVSAELLSAHSIDGYVLMFAWLAETPMADGVQLNFANGQSISAKLRAEWADHWKKSSERKMLFFNADVDANDTAALSSKLRPSDLLSFNLMAGDEICSKSFPVNSSKAAPIWESDYPQPVVPADLPEQFQPEANTRLAKLLTRGQTHLDLKKNYLASHRAGWFQAIKDWTEHKVFKIKSEQDAIAFQQDVPSGSQAFWLGYSSARATIESRSN